MKTRHNLITATRPDWSRPVNVEYEFKTSVITNFDGTEQRAALRSTPRVEVQHDVLVLPGEQRVVWADLVGSQDEVFALPFRWRRVAITAHAGADVDIESVPFWAVPGARAVLSSDTEEEAVTVASIAANTVTLSAPPTGDYSANSRLIFAHDARVADDAGFAAVTDRVFSDKQEWAVDPATTPQAALPISPTQFGGFDVFEGRPDWSKAPEFIFESTRRVFDAGRGRIDVSNPRSFNPLVMRFAFTEITRDTAEEVLSFYLRQKGKRGSFYMPTHKLDMEHTGGVSGSDTLLVDDPSGNFLTTYPDHPVFNTIQVRLPDGSFHYTRIGSVAYASETQTLVTVDTPWPADFPASARVSWCPLVRFAADKLNVRWITDSVAEMRVAVQAIKNGGA